MLRIFLVSSHFSAILQSIYAASTKKEGDVDVLMIDYPPKKTALTQLILDTKFIHNWDVILNYAPELRDETNMRPSLKKRLTRKAKQLPLLKDIYNKMLSRHMFAFFKDFENRIRQDLSKVNSETVQLNMLTKTGLNGVLHKIYPKAEINYFEHGIGDYLYYEQNEIQSGNLFCLFPDEFQAYLKSINNPNEKKINGFIYGDLFYNAVQNLETNKVISNEKEFEKLGNEKLVFILIESMEIYEVPSNFWQDCIQLYLSRIDVPDDYTYVLKPHPLQSFEAINTIESYFKQRGLKYILLGNSKFINVGAELIFYFFSKQTKYVFSLFSSSLYYFTKLYPSSEIKYYHGYKLFEKYTKNSPKQFVDIYNACEPIITNVLAKDCLEL
ncbi:MAG: hypothetical protein IPG89_01670 [Bacteroidetes bacterium]|nr:hypothetical protein [Bacteroidota bacterium]